MKSRNSAKVKEKKPERERMVTQKQREGQSIAHRKEAAERKKDSKATKSDQTLSDHLTVQRNERTPKWAKKRQLNKTPPPGDDEAAKKEENVDREH